MIAEMSSVPAHEESMVEAVCMAAQLVSGR
jgi:hypothetical protein